MKIHQSDFDDPTQAYEKWLETMTQVRVNRTIISRLKIGAQLDKLPSPTEYSDEFLGVYVFGGHKEFKLVEHETAFASFRKCSQKFYPLYFFYSDWEYRGLDEGFKEIVLRYGPMKVIEIKPITNINDYSKFMLWDLWDHLPKENEKILTFQDDGHLVNPGWEKFINKHDPDYIGSHYEYDPEDWKKVLYIKDFEKFGGTPPDFLMNGGFSFRKKSKMMEISNLISEQDIDYERLKKDKDEGDRTNQELHGGPRLNEDMVINYFGFGKEILKPVSPEIANKFSSCSYNKNMWTTRKSFGFHGYGF